MADHFAYARPRPHKSAQTARTLRFRRSCPPRVVSRTREQRDSSRFGPVVGHGRVGGIGAVEIARAAAADLTMVLMDDLSYPPRLEEIKEICDPPPILRARGNAEVLVKAASPWWATRHPTPYGSGMAERLACELAAPGLVIVMARLVMARGVDRASRRGAICAKGKTFAVFGTGVDVIHPQENWRLAEQILALLHRPSSNRAPKLVAT